MREKESAKIISCPTFEKVAENELNRQLARSAADKLCRRGKGDPSRANSYKMDASDRFMHLYCRCGCCKSLYKIAKSRHNYLRVND